MEVQAMRAPMPSAAGVRLDDMLCGADLPPIDGPLTLRLLQITVYSRLAAGFPIDELPAEMEREMLHGDVRAALAELKKLGLSAGQAWIVMAAWICERDRGAFVDELRELRPHLDAIEATKLEAARKIVDRHLGRHSIDAWVPSRVERLKRALLGGRSPG
jgi:hypothetical protein